MLALLGSVLTSGALVLLFRFYTHYNLSLIQVIAINYITCVICGLLISPDYFTAVAALPKEWLPLGILQGLTFVSVFFFIGRAAQKIGVAYTAMVTKTSVVIPTLISAFVYHESLDGLRWAGMACALLAIFVLHLKYFHKAKPENHGPHFREVLPYSLILFFGTGTAETLPKVFEKNYGDSVPHNLYVITLFATAAVVSGAVAGSQIVLKKDHFRPANLAGGGLLGVINYFSMVFFMLALTQLAGPVFYPVNNVGVLVFVALAGLVLFKERFTTSSWVGLALAVLSIMLVAHQELGVF